MLTSFTAVATMWWLEVTTSEYSLYLERRNC